VAREGRAPGWAPVAAQLLCSRLTLVLLALNVVRERHVLVLHDARGDGPPRSMPARAGASGLRDGAAVSRGALVPLPGAPDCGSIVRTGAAPPKSVRRLFRGTFDPADASSKG
jgi:hypothetical protein